MLKIIGRGLGEIVAKKILEGLDKLLKLFFDEVERIVPEKYYIGMGYTSKFIFNLYYKLNLRCRVNQY